MSGERIAALPHVAMAPRPESLTEDGLAVEFTRLHGDELRYVHEWGKWLRWDGHRWANERTLAVYDLARKLVRAVGRDVEPKLAGQIKRAATVHAVVTLARVDRAHARVTEDFDADPWLLNTPAGTIDLRTGAMRPACRGDGITKMTPTAPSAVSSPLWLACLETWTGGDAELSAFLQRLCGYWLTGSVREEKLAIVYGPGGNGKTKFVETLRACLGADYAAGVAMETLVVTKGEQHPTDLADLRGARLAVAMETEEGRRLAESKIKMLTGGEKVKARRMRQDFFEFEPTHKIVIVGNHRPVLRNVDEAMRRRLLLIPFTAVIPPEERDEGLADKLMAERPAILGWMLAGCRAWLDRGLAPPARVLAATEDYFVTADTIGQWIEERCTMGPALYMTKAAAYASWKAWAEAAGEFVGSARRLGERLRMVPGVDEARHGRNSAEAWLGIGLSELRG